MPRQHTNKRTSEYLRQRGFTVNVVQNWNHYGAVRHDIFGFIDCLAVRPGYGGVLAAQATTKTRLADHRRLIEESAEAVAWLASGGKLMIFSWRKVGAKGSRLFWEPRIEECGLQEGRIGFTLVDEEGLNNPGSPVPPPPILGTEEDEDGDETGASVPA